MTKDIKFNEIKNWLIHIVGYALILIAVSLIFKKTIYIDDSGFGIWGVIVSIIIYILNKTIKPLIVWLTLPLTALTLGIFYPFINLFILKMADWILGYHFAINGIFIAVLVAILISVMNIIMDEVVIKPMLRKGR